MSQKSTIERLADLLVDQLAIDVGNVKPEAKLDEDLGCDSLDIVEITMAVEEEWDLQIPDDDGEKFKTVGDIVAYVDQHKS